MTKEKYFTFFSKLIFSYPISLLIFQAVGIMNLNYPLDFNTASIISLAASFLVILGIFIVTFFIYEGLLEKNNIVRKITIAAVASLLASQLTSVLGIVQFLNSQIKSNFSNFSISTGVLIALTIIIFLSELAVLIYFNLKNTRKIFR